MADRSSAYLFGEVFRIVAEYVPPGDTRDAMARRLWDLTLGYDFTDNQMNADEALLALGLARRGVDPDWPDEGEVVLYGPA
jgi:hypothetical protein